MSNDYDSTLAELVTLLREFAASEHPLSADARLVDDLGLESVQIMEFVAEIEDHFDIAISLTGLADVRTLGDLARFVSACRAAT